MENKNSIKRLENGKDYKKEFENENIEEILLICNKTNKVPVSVSGFDGIINVFSEGTFKQGNMYSIPFTKLEWNKKRDADFFISIRYKNKKIDKTIPLFS